MKLFAVSNGNSDSDFELNDDMVAGGSNAHSGGCVVLAETIEEAQRIIDKAIVDGAGYDLEERNVGTIKEIPLNKSGVVLFAGGDC